MGCDLEGGESLIKVLRFDQYRSMSWKNGRGTTAQIAIFPENAPFPGDDFLWRVSTAKVTASGPFSAFPGCDRILAVWQGPGLLLGGQCLTPLVPMKFTGDEPLECALLGGPVLDLGVIYRRGRVTADMRLENLVAGVPRPALALGDGVHFLVCAAGSFDVDGVRASTGDTLRVEGPVLLNMRAVSAGEARVFRISLLVNG